MDSVSATGSSLYLGAHAMTVHSTGMRVAAHNVANVSTDDFIPQQALYATGPGGIGVDLDAVRKIGPSLGGLAESPPACANGRKPSGTELAVEFPDMIVAQRAYEANAAVVRASDGMYDTLLSIIA